MLPAGRGNDSHGTARAKNGAAVPFLGRTILRWLERIESFVEEFRAWDGPSSGVVGDDPLGWPDYAETRARARLESGCVESVVTGDAVLRGDATRSRLAVVASAFEFIGGSMGLAAGERIVAAYDRAREERLPVLVLARSGGARIQEGMVALVQMARVADAARRHADAGLLQVAYLDSPTTGGVYASIVSLADVVWAAPRALIGFAGPRVVELTTGERLVDDEHTAESAAATGIIDAVLTPGEARDALAILLAAIRRPKRRPNHGGHRRDTANRSVHQRDANGEPARLLDPWAEVQRARARERPSGRWWLDRLLPRRVECRGDRVGGLDPVVVAGIGLLDAAETHDEPTSVAFVAIDRHTGNGRPGPAGYRTARRVLALSRRLGLPVLTLVDTPGADPSPASERAGIAGEIARTLAALAAHSSPTVSLVVGEGGSGGALALAAADRCFLLDGSIFSVIGPEGAAAILERDAERAADVAPLLKLTGSDLLALGIVDGVIRAEPVAGVADALRAALAEATPGDGRARLDAATSRWLHPGP